MFQNRGFILLLVFIFMVILTALVGAFLFITTYESRDLGVQVEDVKLLNLAEAGVQKALRVIRDDVLSTTQTGTADLRGADTTGSVSIDNVENLRYIDNLLSLINNNNDIAQVSVFDSNYSNAHIVSVFLGVRAQLASGGSADIQVSYTTNGVFPQAGNTVLTQGLTGTLTDYYVDITSDRVWTWSIILNPNFIVRAVRPSAGARINLDALYLRVTYEIDTNTESWYTGSFASFPISLGSGAIQSISIVAEQGKVHLNTASQTLLSYLMQEFGVAAGTANTLAANIITYRTTNPFDTVEELQQVSGMTSAEYNLIKDYVTVYSFINSNTFRLTGARAPVNINTASSQVLEAVFDALTLGATDAASLAADIISFRASTPFTCFYSSNAAVTTDFYDFVLSRVYLSTTGDPDEQDMVLDNADASSLVSVSGSTGFNGVTTEFCYDTNSFKVDSLADISGRRFRIKTILADDGAHIFTTYSGDTTQLGYRAENFE